MTKGMTPAGVMVDFLRYAYAQLGYPELSPADAILKHLTETLRLPPEKASSLSDRAVREHLHSIWQAFLGTERDRNPDVPDCYLHVLDREPADSSSVIWNTIR